ncbi:peptidoglycan-binding protein [Ramlibacter sp.]|uniref:peptidoglycan-binding protein n=1 Tax=Ramlibacter sp. TaxID=1917967 RepID=UPI00262DF8DF|nr:peptidoglycan-binding protein [Ramlibacter sp.]MDB5956043.1 Peptidoglycan-binding domain 1 protein [Ramlibacter sp.]
MSEVFSTTVLCSDCGERRLDLEGTGHHVVDCREDPALASYCVLRYTRPSAWTAGPPPALTASQAQAAKAIVNLFETGSVRGDYGAVTLLPGDTGRLTFGRAQTTLGSGNLHLLAQRYCGTVGARFAGRLRAWLPALAGRSSGADEDPKLHNLLRATADDPLMRDVQDAFFDELYWDPAVRAASRLGIRTPLGIAVVYDSWVHGAWPLLRDRTQAAGALAQVGEHEWVQRYLRLRGEWLATHPNALLRATVYRMDALQRLIEQDAWALPLPLVVRGEEISAASLVELPRGCHDGPEPGTRELGLRSPLLRGLDVRLVQLALSDQGCDVRADGIFGSASARFVRAFQRSQELPETGAADARLIERLIGMDG